MQLKFLSLCLVSFFCLNADLPFIQQNKASQDVSMTVQSVKAQEMENSLLEKKETFPHVENAYIGSLWAEILYWNTVTTDWVLGFKCDFDDDLYSTIHKEIGWGPGGRMGINFSNLSDWTMGLVGTYYHNSKSAHETNDHIYLGVVLSNDHSSYSKITYYTIDLNLSSRLALTKSISFGSLMGAKSVVIRNKLISHVFGYDTHEEPFNSTFASPFKYLGFGPQVGLMGFYKCGTSSFEFFASLNSSLVYGKNSTSLDVKDLIDQSQNHVFNNFHELLASLQIAMGVSWKYCFCDSHYSLGFHLSYEANLWWDITNRIQVIGENAILDNNGSNFTLHGGNFGLTFAF